MPAIVWRLRAVGIGRLIRRSWFIRLIGFIGVIWLGRYVRLIRILRFGRGAAFTYVAEDNDIFAFGSRRSAVLVDDTFVIPVFGRIAISRIIVCIVRLCTAVRSINRLLCYIIFRIMRFQRAGK